MDGHSWWNLFKVHDYKILYNVFQGNYSERKNLDRGGYESLSLLETMMVCDINQILFGLLVMTLIWYDWHDN